MNDEEVQFRVEVITRLTRIEEKQEAFLARLEKTEGEIPPLRKHVNMMGGALGLLVVLGIALSTFDKLQDFFVGRPWSLGDTGTAVLNITPGTGPAQNALDLVQAP